MGAEDFEEALRSLLHLDGRQITIRTKHTLGGPSRQHESVYVNFVNLPAGLGRGGGGGAEAENNRMSFWVRGFHGSDPRGVPPTGKVKVEMATSAFPRSLNLRAKTGTPDAIAKYLATYINRIVVEVPPKLTHSSVVTAADIARGAGVKV